MNQLLEYHDEQESWLDYIPLKLKSLNKTSQLLRSSSVT